MGTEDINTEGKSIAPTGNGKKIRAGIILSIFFGVIIAVLLWWWIHNINRIATDNAFIEAHLHSVSSRVAGRVERVAVKDNQFVRKGDLLFEIDQADFRVKIDEASATLEMTRNETSGDVAKVDQSRAELEQSKARLLQAGSDLKRGKALFAKEVIPREQLERLETASKVAAAQVEEKEENLKRTRAEAGMSSSGSREAKSAQRKAQLEAARLQAGYTRIIAPADGFVTRKSIEPGNYIQTGQPAMVLVSLDDSWVTANYKESQLTWVKPGQKVEFKVDTYPGKKFTGSVESIMAGTGSVFSLFPPENATGNYVKVVQRIPVRIAIDHKSDPEHLLRAGMSVEPTIFTGRTVKDALHNMNPFR